jgi:asparagine synthase (glutamine-hydrolysing)
MAYLILTCDAGMPALALERMVEDLVGARGWTLARRAHGLAALTRGGAPPKIQVMTGLAGVGGFVVGEIHDRAATTAGEVGPVGLAGLADLEPLQACGRLIAQAWGGYVAVHAASRREPPAILRDPTGALEAFVWGRDDVVLIGSEIPDGAAAPQGLVIDQAAVAAVLADPGRGAGALLLKGLVGVDPGVCRFGVGAGQEARLWSPAAIVRAARRKAQPTPEDLRATVDACVVALASDAARIVCEISGGLDSAIVATSLTAGDRRPDRAINFYRDQVEADERPYAQAVADRIGARLDVVRREVFAVSEDTLARGASAVRPNFNGLDPDYDRLLSQALLAASADVLFTGHGGDVVFYQIGAAEIAADLLKGEPARGSRAARLAEIARRTRRSIWSLAWEALRGRPGTGSPSRMVRRGELFPVKPTGVTHPWLADRRGVSAAKRVQIRGLVNSLALSGATGHGQVARIAHPLLSQPVIELCLAIPAPILSQGEGDRSLARETFADRLPPLVAQRRSKGDISVFFGRTLAASAGFLRDYLTDGRLARRGLLDAGLLDAALKPEAMVWKDATVEILTAMTLEAWLRHWEDRIAAIAGSGAAPDTEPDTAPDAAPKARGGGARATSRKAKARR